MSVSLNGCHYFYYLINRLHSLLFQKCGNFFAFLQQLHQKNISGNLLCVNGTGLRSAFIGASSRPSAGQEFYAFTTPIIILLGIVGNLISLNVFMTKSIRKVSSSFYLIVLSISDLVVLLVYVFLEWLDRGLPFLPGRVTVSVIAIPGICRVFLYLSYASRFISAWLIVMFTGERYIGVCRPLQKRRICTHAFARRMVLGLVVLSLVLCIYKPALSGVDVTGKVMLCTTLKDHQFVSFILDTVYAMSTTIIPFLVITSFNCMIIKQLCIRSRLSRQMESPSGSKVLRLEITLIMLVISSCFVLVTLPYFVTWFSQFLSSKYVRGFDNATHKDRVNANHLRNVRYVTKTIYFLNFSMNFFLYSVTGTHFRQALRGIFCDKIRLLKRQSSESQAKNTLELTSSSSEPQGKLIVRQNKNELLVTSAHTSHQSLIEIGSTL